MPVSAAAAPTSAFQAAVAGQPVPGAVVANVVDSADLPPVEGTVIDDHTQSSLRALDSSIKRYTAIKCGSRIYFKVQAKLTSGLTSYVYHVQDLYTEADFALKMVPLQSVHTTVARADLEALQRFSHENVLKYMDNFVFCIKGTQFLCIQLELTLKGSLRTLIERKRGQKEVINIDPILSIMYQLASGLVYIHQLGTIHGNLSPDSVLLTRDHSVKLCNFGLLPVRRRVGAALSVTGGLRLYAPPEWAHREYDPRPLSALEVPHPSYDMWGVGCLLVELCSQQLLEERIAADSSLALDDGVYQALVTRLRAAHGGAFRQLGEKLLLRDPDDRASAVEVEGLLRPVFTDLKASWGKTLSRCRQFFHRPHVPLPSPR